MTSITPSTKKLWVEVVKSTLTQNKKETKKEDELNEIINMKPDQKIDDPLEMKRVLSAIKTCEKYLGKCEDYLDFKKERKTKLYKYMIRHLSDETPFRLVFIPNILFKVPKYDSFNTEQKNCVDGLKLNIIDYYNKTIKEHFLSQFVIDEKKVKIYSQMNEPELKIPKLNDDECFYVYNVQLVEEDRSYDEEYYGSLSENVPLTKDVTYEKLHKCENENYQVYLKKFLFSPCEDNNNAMIISVDLEGRGLKNKKIWKFDPDYAKQTPYSIVFIAPKWAGDALQYRFTNWKEIDLSYPSQKLYELYTKFCDEANDRYGGVPNEMMYTFGDMINGCLGGMYRYWYGEDEYNDDE